jgi:hypothetical protein
VKISKGLLLLSGLLTTAISVQARRPIEHPEVLAVIVSYDSTPSEGTVRALKDEIQAIFKIESARIVWRDYSQIDPRESFDHLVVTHVTGHCEMLTQGAPEVPRRALGFTHVSDGKVIPFVQIDCDKVAALLGPVKVVEPVAHRESLFGRALARILGHEMYHVIGETQGHNRHGLAKAALTAQDLMSDWLGFEREDLELIEEKIEQSMPDVMTR